MPPTPNYVTKHDTLYRNFAQACKDGIDDPTKGPMLHEFMGALMCCPGYTEGKLPKAWTDFANARPRLANYLRVHCQGFDIGDGERFHPGTVEGYKKPKALLRVSNPAYIGGKPLGDGSGRTTAEKKQETKKRKRANKAGEDEGASDAAHVAGDAKRQKHEHNGEEFDNEAEYEIDEENESGDGTESEDTLDVDDAEVSACPSDNMDENEADEPATTSANVDDTEDGAQEEEN